MMCVVFAVVTKLLFKTTDPMRARGTLIVPPMVPEPVTVPLIAGLVKVLFVSVCVPEDPDCESGPASTWNIPQFIQVDLTAKRLSTTKSSGQNRSTPIENLQKKEGAVYLQGVENGRAFSIRIDEASGEMSAAVARDGVVVAVFGMCTPGSGH